MKQPMYYEETPDKNKQRKIFRKKELEMKSKVETKQPVQKTEKKKKITLSVYIYLNFRRFGVSIDIDNGIKINVLCFETHIKFEKK